MNRKWVISLVFLILMVASAILLLDDDAASQTEDLLVQPQVGPFKVTVSSTGELRAKNSVKIYGPSRARQARIYEIKILQLIPEGTVVQKGDFVAELDMSELNSKIQEAQIELQKAESQYTQTELDTALNLSKARDEMINLRYSMEEARLRKEQSAYEPPTVQRQEDINFEKAERALEQATTNYKTQVDQAVAQIKEKGAELTKVRNEVNDFLEISKTFSISAPEKGMLIYRRDWRGNKITVGETISAWDPVVAELPDLTVMESITYVNEVDIQKVKTGQIVEVGLDADAEKVLTGKVTEVANIGEQRPNSDAKVFQVAIQLNEADSTLRPAMTTSNLIVVAEYEDVMFLPLESIHSTDSLNFVYVREEGRIRKKEVTLGMLNDNEAIIEAGLVQDENVFLSLPALAEDVPIILLEPEPAPKAD